MTQSTELRWSYAVWCGICTGGLFVMATELEQLQPEQDQHSFLACMDSTLNVTPFVTKACQIDNHFLLR
jgi:hypothetical protein